MESKLDSFFREVSVKSEYSNDDEDRVLGYILSVGTAYNSDISKHLLLSSEQVSAIVINLINKELLTRMIPDQYYPQPLMRARIAEMWAIGLVGGYKDFINRSWFIATEKGINYYSNKFKGEHRRISCAYLETYPEIELTDNGTNN